MIPLNNYAIIANDPDNFRIRFPYQKGSAWKASYPFIFLTVFQETIRNRSEGSLDLSSFNLEVFENDPGNTDIFSESMFYHIDPYMIKVQGYLYTPYNRMLCQATAQFLTPKK